MFGVENEFLYAGYGEGEVYLVFAHDEHEAEEKIQVLLDKKSSDLSYNAYDLVITEVPSENIMWTV